MKFTLHDFQEKAAVDILENLEDAVSRFDKRGRPAAISLSAVTGSGKTVIATAVLEALLVGSELDIAPNPELTVLWLTDDPNLNEQTRRKILIASDRIEPQQLVAIGDENPLDQKTLDPGKIYFLNIHKLGKGATRYVKKGDRRQYSLWDTIRNTIRTHGSNFLLIIDEAHRGTSNKGNGERKTIAAKLIGGGAENGTPPTPIVLGISATPERFDQAVKGMERTLMPVVVDIEEVRASGLIKDLVAIRYPTEAQPSDITFIEQSIEDILQYDNAWKEYTNTTDQAEVHPVLVIQVPPSISKNDLGAIVQTLKAKWSGLDDKAIGHSFQERNRLDLGDHTVRYVAPQNIQDDPFLRVVLFKEALTTGWDCPRAEVMVSLRRATDTTYIAQLIGRMVRTPLARRVPAKELLNSVTLHLPHFDATSVNQVIDSLSSGEDQIASEVTTNPIVCKKNTTLPEQVWAAAEAIPTYTRPSKVHRNEVARLNSFALLLAMTELTKEAPRKAEGHIVGTMEREAKRLGAALDKTVDDLKKIEYETRTVETLRGERDDVAQGQRDASARNIDDLFKQARRIFGDAAATWYWNHLCDKAEEENQDLDPYDAKLRVAALAQDKDAVDAVHTAATGLINTFRKEYDSQIGELQDADRDRFYAIFQQSRSAELIKLMLPDDITVSGVKKAVRYEKHLYVNGSNKFPADVNNWEIAVLERWLPLSVAWYRNPTAGRRAVAVPYKAGSEGKTLYPDLIFFRETDEGIVVDIVDPHGPKWGDTTAKWIGLADYAEKHKAEVGQVVAVIEHKDEYWRLDLRNSTVRDEMKKASSEADVRKIFESYGGKL